jgi:hypothetical protein
VRITPGQKILIPWVEEKFLYDIYAELSEKVFINGKVPESAREIVSRISFTKIFETRPRSQWLLQS